MSGILGYLSIIFRLELFDKDVAIEGLKYAVYYVNYKVKVSKICPPVVFISLDLNY